MSSSQAAVRLSFRPVLDVDPRLISLLRQRAFTTESLIKELVKNSYEAEAEELHITVHPEGDMEFRDAGKYAGMSVEDLKAFLTIGTTRKVGKRFTEHYKRPISGEQGIGRLSVTQLYRVIEVETERDGTRFRFSVTEDMFDRALASPVDLSDRFEVIEPTGVNGTKIMCMGLKEGFEKPDPKRIRKYIESNFLHILLNPIGTFNVYVNGEPVKARVPKGVVLVQVDKEVEGVVVKGAYAESSRITGCIALTDAPFEDCGVQLSVNGSPIGPRRSLGELVGDRKVDDAIPASRIWGWVEAPFLKYTIGRDYVDTNHISYLKFREKMMEVVEEVRVALKGREREELSRVEEWTVKEVCKILAQALEGEPELKPQYGTVSIGATGGTMLNVTTDRVRPPPPRGEGTGQGKAEPRRTHQTHPVHSLQPQGLQRKLREKGSWTIELCFLDDPDLISMKDWICGVIRVNKAHPLYVRRMRDKRLLKKYLLEVSLFELTNISIEEKERNKIWGRLRNRLEVLSGGTLL